MLINLVSIHPCFSPQSVPLAAAFLKSCAAGLSATVVLTDFFLAQDAAACSRELDSANPAAVGFSMYVWNRERCIEIATMFRRRHPGIPVFAGGPEVTADPHGILQSGAFDFIVTGEGEVAFRSIAERLIAGTCIRGIASVYFPGDALQTPGTPPVGLDSIASPYLSGILDTSRYPGLLWQLSRGCGFSCDFCFDSRTADGVRRFSLPRIEQELRHFVNSGVTQIFVLDSTFNQDAKRAKTILRMIHAIAPQIHFHFEVRSEFIDREMADLFSRITCSLQIGLQSADATVLKNVGRSFRREEFAAKIGFLNDCGAVFGFDLIYGLPGDTLKGFQRSLDFALSLYPNHLDIFPLAILPGTRLAERGSELKLQWEPQPPYTLLSSESFCAADLNKARQLASACDIFYTRGKVVSWFNAVLYVLKLAPSSFLHKFSEWLATTSGGLFCESQYNDDEIYGFQRAFLQLLFSGKPLKRFMPLVEDLLTYHQLYAAVLLAPSPSAPANPVAGSELLYRRLRLSSSALIGYFNYDLDEILECGATDIHWMADTFSPVGSAAVLYPRDNIVQSESLDQHYLSLLSKLDGTKPVTDLLPLCGLSTDEAAGFLEIAYQERIVVEV